MQHGLEQTSAGSFTRAEYTARERAVLELGNISGRGKSRLQSVLRMEQIAADFRHRVDRKGTVMFTLQDGASVRDNGTDIMFSAGNESARQTALLYARKKWEKRILLEANRIVRHQEPNRNQTLER